MGYRVDYVPVDRVFRGKKERMLRVPALSALFFLIFVLLVRLFWAQGTETLRAVLLPGDWQATGQALEALADRLGMGEPFGDAVSVFCREIIQEAGIGIG